MINFTQKRILIIDAHAEIHQQFYKMFVYEENDPLLDATNKMLFGRTATLVKSNDCCFEIDSAYKPEEALDMVRKAVSIGRPYALIFIDIKIQPKLGGIDLIKKLWALDSDIQIVIATSHIDTSWEDISSRLNKSDNFLILKKPLAPIEVRQLAYALTTKWELRHQVRYQIENLEALLKDHVEKINHVHNELQEQSIHDSLTGLPNRNLLMDRIQQAMVQAKRYEMQLGILFFEIDHFKQLSKSLGPDLDEILKKVSERLSGSIRDTDTLARMGPHQFVAVFMAQPKEEYFVAIAHKLLKQMDKPFLYKNHAIQLTARIGMSLYPAHGKEVITLLKNADRALHRAKEENSRFLIFREEFNRNFTSKIDLADSLSHAIERNELLLLYQPIIDLHTETITGVETLLRWRHPLLGLLSPLEFMAIAEELNLATPIGNWVIKQACTQLNEWMKKGLKPLNISINISNQHFRQDHFVQTLYQICEDTKCDPKDLELELTEDVLVGKQAPILHKMKELRNGGISLVMDDFGVGYTSLGYLRQFPFNKVKIDRSLIQGIYEKPEDAAMVGAIITLCKKLKLFVVAEGVETFGQLDYLRLHASDEVQAYIFHKPLEEKLCFLFLQKKSKVTS